MGHEVPTSLFASLVTITLGAPAAVLGLIARVPLKITVRPLLRGRLGQVLVGVSLFETANVATTQLILRATQLLLPSLGVTTATSVAIGLYAGYNVAATVASFPRGA